MPDESDDIMEVAKLLWGRTIIFKSKISVGVIAEGSISGSGRLEDLRTWLFPTIDSHCEGRPLKNTRLIRIYFLLLCQV